MNWSVGIGNGNSTELDKFNYEEEEQMNQQYPRIASPVTDSDHRAEWLLHDSSCDWDKDAPQPATIAALEFQVACLVNDRFEIVNWPSREPLVVNKPGDLSRKYEALRRIAKAHFPLRGDVEDVLDHTIDEYKLWTWSNPIGFWIAFKRNMIDAAKAACNAKSVCLERSQRVSTDGVRRKSNSHEWAESPEIKVVDDQIGENWLLKQSVELHAAEPSVSCKWEIAQASDHELDRLVCAAVRRLAADDDYMEELASTKHEAAKLPRIVAEIRFLTNCSQAQAYRLLDAFRRRHSSAEGRLRQMRIF